MAQNDAKPTGLGGLPADEWPKVSASDTIRRPIDRLVPGSQLHQRVLNYLLERLDLAEREMSSFYSRWQVQEKKLQAYINLNDFERKLKEMNRAGYAPKVVSVQVPYAFSTLSTVVTYLLHTFCGRRPMLQVGSYKKETFKNAQMMELVLQYNADHIRLVREIYQWLMDMGTYGVGILRTDWRVDRAMRTVWRKNPQWGFMNVFLGSRSVKVREERTVYAGNMVSTLDPYMFFPDPRVPMVEVSRRGEFCFWRTFEGLHSLKMEEAAGRLKWIDYVGDAPDNRHSHLSARSLLAGGAPVAGTESRDTMQRNFKQIDQGTVVIIPRELGLSEETRPQMWIFAIGNRNQIIQAQVYEHDHGMHPVAVAEPWGSKYSFGNLGLLDYLDPIQDTLSWLVNSHMDNVRTALNNIIIFDPSMLEEQDMKNPGAGKLVRVKRAGYGRDIGTMFRQLAVVDVTQNHLRDFQLFMRMGDVIAGANDNLRGVQTGSSRRSATEARTANEAAASRLAALSRVISSQGMVDLAEQMSLNVQQFMDEEFYISLVGMEGVVNPLHLPDKAYDKEANAIRIQPEMLVGDFYFPIHDGTLPLDRVALLDVWKEIFLGISSDPALRQQYNLGGIFDYLAELAGAKNLDRFKIQLQPMAPGQEPPAESMPLPMRRDSGGNTTPGVEPAPGDRLAQGLAGLQG